MSAIDAELKRIIKQVTNPKDAARYEGLLLLEQLKNENEEPVDMDIMKKMIETAALDFPHSGEEWDEPSYALIDFVCDYRNEEIIDGISKHYNGFSWSAKIRALSYLIELGQDKSLSAFMDILEGTMKDGSSPLLVGPLMENPELAVKVVEKFYPYLQSDFYKRDLYELILLLHRDDVFYQFKKDEVFPQLIIDYKKEIEVYARYNESYSTKNVYSVWKNEYLACRDKMDIYLSLFAYYYMDELKPLIVDALYYEDPILKTRAVIASLQRDIEVSDIILVECATDLESAYIFHWELMRIRKEHISPAEKKQPVVARTHLFYYALDNLEEPNVPNQVNIVDHIDTQNHYGQPVRYHLARMRIEGRDDMPGWIGAFALEDGDDSLFMWDGTYVDEVPFDQYTVEEHKKRFIERRKNEKNEMQNEVHFEHENKNDKLYIQGDTLFVEIEGEKSNLKLHEMKRVSIETKKGGFLGLFKKDYIAIYNKENELAITLPDKFIDYGDLGVAIYEQTSHLKEPPYIEYIEFE